MAKFLYEARDKFGKLVTGSISGDSVYAVSNRLQAAGYVPVRIDLRMAEKKHSLPFFKEKVKNAELNLFTRQLLTLQRAGLPLLAGMRSLEEQANNKMLKKAITHIIIDIEGGMSLHEALSRQPEIFNGLYINMVEAGEASGKLDEVLESIAFLSERNEETQSKIKGALRYPALTFMAMTGAFFLIVSFVMPRFGALFAQFDAQLPLPTRMLLGLNHILHHYWALCASVAGASFWLFQKYIKTKSGEKIWHGALLRLPVFGKLLHEVYMSRFARNLATLIESGLPILQALELVAGMVSNVIVREGVYSIRAAVREGRSMSEPMRESKLFSSMVTQMIAIGEETGRIDELLTHVANYYDRETDIKTKNLTILIEPVLIAIMGVMVLILAMGVFLPMWNLVSVFKRA